MFFCVYIRNNQINKTTAKYLQGLCPHKKKKRSMFQSLISFLTKAVVIKQFQSDFVLSRGVFMYKASVLQNSC